MGEMLATERLGRMSRTVSFIIVVTLITEFIGAVLMYPMFASAANGPGTTIGPGTAAWRSAFHAISSFCNAGFSLFNDNLMLGVSGGWTKPLRDYWQIYGVLASLIVVGGLGFPVLEDVGTCFWYRSRLPLLGRGNNGRPLQPHRADRRSAVKAITGGAAFQRLVLAEMPAPFFGVNAANRA